VCVCPVTSEATNCASVHVSVCVCVCMYRPLRADERLPVLTHRLVTDTAATDDKDASQRHKKKDRKVCCRLSILCFPQSVHLLFFE